MNFIRSAFRTVRQNPALIFAEIAWRWTFGFVAWLLVIFTVRIILEGIGVSAAEIALVRSDNAYLIADAIARTLVQVLPRFVVAMLLAIPLIAAIWTVAATVGRAATLEALLELRRAPAQFSPDVISTEAERSDGGAKPQRRTYVFRLFLLNCVRAVFTLATMLAFFGTVFLVSAQFTSRTAPGVAPVFIVVWLFLAFVVASLWGLVNWFLALAPIFIVRDRLGIAKAISASLGLYRDATREYLSIATWFGFFRGTALLVAIVAGLLSATVGLRAGLIGGIVIALIYFAIADWLYVVRLAAYIRLAEPSPEAQPAPAAEPAPNASTLKLETET
jgi:hypothetical protein